MYFGKQDYTRKKGVEPFSLPVELLYLQDDLTNNLLTREQFRI